MAKFPSTVQPFARNKALMIGKARLAIFGAGVPKGVRLVLIDFVVPVCLAWVCVSLGFNRLGSGPRSAVEEPAAYGPVRLKVKLPGTSGEIPEPLFVCGRPGKQLSCI